MTDRIVACKFAEHEVPRERRIPEARACFMIFMLFYAHAVATRQV